jgi:hypothetical protein
MGLLSYVRDRKQVNASRAGQGVEKISRGDFSHFGGSNGASVGVFDTEDGQRPGPQPANQGYKNSKPKSEVEPTNYPKNPDHSWADENKDKFSNMGVGRPGTSAQNQADGPETRESELARGAAMKSSSGDVTVLGPVGKKNGERFKIDGDTRGRVRAMNSESARRGDSGSDVPSKAAVDKENNRYKKTSNKNLWED